MVRALRVARLVGLFALVVILTSGCAGENKSGLPRYKAHGKLLVKGKPLEGVQVVLFSTDAAREKENEANHIARPSGLTDAEGNFTLGISGDDKGAPAGEYKVVLTYHAQRGMGNTHTGSKLGSAITSQYGNPKTTPFQVKIGEGPDNELPTIKVP
ncbi:hypothetical protein KIH39_23870 [Telmatocola sphagniphila]|uniref:Carboxypeptidase regulatory-like domain-containing protein n=1 Tax=Telmatocola sphagniphila TaxID=1123043 RepID=A0A8E6EUW9_9BACT|nr:hypothetical protein [Telmatocola sphagniphila]QVL31837.1 hypothetical protein KIH39_23870 [Telmatocola sphagniphila]